MINMNSFSFKYRNVILGVTATAVGYCAILMPHTVFLNKYRYVMARYQVDDEVPLSPKIHRAIQEVMDDLKLPNNVRKAIRPFSVAGFDLFHAGTFNTKYGAILGIPANFCNTEEQLHANLQIKNEPIDWTRQDANSFLNALMLSDNAQKFAIAREILLIKAEKPYFNSLTFALIITVSWVLYNAITYKFKLHERNVILCRTLYLALSIFSAILWIGIIDNRSYRQDGENDKALCSLGNIYVKGGQEFYEKMLIRNKAIRSLLEKEGQNVYTANGNELVFFRQKHMPISHRKDFFDSQL